jgi:hypothetical protein
MAQRSQDRRAQQQFTMQRQAMRPQGGGSPP